MVMLLKQLGAFLKCISPDQESDVNQESDVSSINQLIPRFSYAQILRATNNFSPKLINHELLPLTIYEGTLPSGAKVAVKSCNYGLDEFETELRILSQIRHPHIFSFIGYCNESGKRFLVYEYVAGENIRKQLSGRDLECPLTWEQRLQICIDSAEAIHFLHSHLVERVIHRDFTLSTIWVDENFRAKVAAFRHAISGDVSHYSIAIDASCDLLDPEHYSTQQFTEKSDVYSFGVVLLEVLYGRPVLQLSLELQTLIKRGTLSLKKGNLERIDPVLVGKIHPDSFKIYCDTAEQCLTKKRDERPVMREVLWNLEMPLEFQLC